MTEVIVVARLAAMGGFIMLGRITDWTCDRSDRRRAARRDVRVYHVGVAQLKQKKVYVTVGDENMADPARLNPPPGHVRFDEPCGSQ